MNISLAAAVDLLNQAQSLVITAHIHPDGDCLGSMLALAECLEKKGKEVQLLLDDDVPGVYNFLPGFHKINRPGKSPVASDLLVVVDASDADRIAGVKAVVDAKILNIDHHVSNTLFADYWYVDSKAAATGEIILDILRLLKTEITKTQATNLYTAIATDCGFFRYANTTAKTLQDAAILVEAGAKPHLISESLETKSLDSIMTLRSILDTLEIYYNGKIASITVSQNIIDENNGETTEGLVNYPRNIEGVEVAIMFKIMDDNTTRVSLRSRGADVSKLALSFGGGGHIRAAGCTVNGIFPIAKERIIQAAEKLLTEAGE